MPPDLDPTTVPMEAPGCRTADSDAALLRRYAEHRDEPAFAEVVRRHVDFVHSAAVRQLAGERLAAEDVTQAVFTELARHAGRLSAHPTLAGWLFTTTRCIAANVRRAEWRRRRREYASLSLTMEPTDERLGLPHDAPDWSAIATVIDEVMHELGERDRSAILLRFFQCQPFAEIGQALGLTGNAARMRVDRALDRLRDRLAKRGILSTSAALAVVLTANAIHAAPAGLSATVASVSLAAATGAAVPTAFSSLISAMLSLKSKILLGGALAALVAMPLVWQQQDVRRLRQGLAAANAARRSLAETEAGLRRSLELAETENQRLRDGQIELLRLRGEIGPLREQLRSLTRSVSSTRPAPSSRGSAAGSDSRGTDPSDMGAATAEHAATSLIWAVAQGRVDRLADLLELPASVTPEDAPRHYAFFANQLSNVFRVKDFNGWKVDLAGTTNDDIVRLDYGYRDLESGTNDTFGFYLHHLGPEWKVMVVGEVPEDF